MRINADGRVTIPAHIRDKAGLLPDTEISFELDGDVVRIVKRDDVRNPERGVRIVEGLRGKGDIALTTDEIMALTRGD